MVIGGPGGDLKWHIRPGSQFWGFRGAEDPTEGTTVICAKRSLVKGMRLLLFQLREDGTYRKTCGNICLSFVHKDNKSVHDAEAAAIDGAIKTEFQRGLDETAGSLDGELGLMCLIAHCRIKH